MIKHIVGKRSLGLYILIFLMTFPAVSHAEVEVTLQWNNKNSSCQGYFVFGREDGQDYDYEQPWWQGDNTFSTCTIDDLQDNKTYYFVMRAYAGDNVSADSNEVRFTLEDKSESSDANDNGATLSGATLSSAATLTDDTASDSAGSSSFYESSPACFISSLSNFE